MEEVCTACLCGNRNLYDIQNSNYFSVYEHILKQINSAEWFCGTDGNLLPERICWECCAVLRRIRQFQDTVRQAHILLAGYYHQGSKVPPTEKSRLQIHKVTQTTYIQSSHDLDLEIKEEPADLHEELDTFADRLQVDVACKDEEHNIDDKAAVSSIIGDERRSKDDKHRSKSKKKRHRLKTKVKKKHKQKTEIYASNGFSDSDTPLSNYEDAAAKFEESKVSGVNGNVDAGQRSPGLETRMKSDDPGKSLEPERDVNSGTELAKKRQTDDKRSSAKLRNVTEVRTKVKTRLPIDKEERPQCVECGKSFSSRKTYRYHLNVLHKGQNSYPCPRCGKVYQWKSNLGRHIRTHRARDADELFCEPCDRRFSSVATYRQHLRISRRHVAEDDFTFMCNECGKRFVNKVRLRDHIDWEHLNNIKFSCQLCHKAFKCHTSLYVHTQNVHRNREKKDNLCHVCGKSYQNAAKLRYHIVAMHSGETPYSCGQCRASFGWYSSLYRHVREVHRIGP